MLHFLGGVVSGTVLLHSGPHTGGTGHARPGRAPDSMQATGIQKPEASCLPQASGHSEWPYVAEVVSEVLGRRGQGSGPSKSTGLAAGSVSRHSAPSWGDDVDQPFSPYMCAVSPL